MADGVDGRDVKDVGDVRDVDGLGAVSIDLVCTFYALPMHLQWTYLGLAWGEGGISYGSSVDLTRCKGVGGGVCGC